MTFFITPFHYTDCFSVRQIGYGGKGYLNHTQSEEFQKEYGDRPVILRVTLGREPDEHILALLSKCPAWAADYGVKLEIEIGGKQVRIVES